MFFDVPAQSVAVGPAEAACWVPLPRRGAAGAGAALAMHTSCSGQCRCFWERVKETLPENGECSCLDGTGFAFFFSGKKFYLQELAFGELEKFPSLGSGRSPLPVPAERV